MTANGTPTVRPKDAWSALGLTAWGLERTLRSAAMRELDAAARELRAYGRVRGDRLTLVQRLLDAAEATKSLREGEK